MANELQGTNHPWNEILVLYAKYLIVKRLQDYLFLVEGTQEGGGEEEGEGRRREGEGRRRVAKGWRGGGGRGEVKGQQWSTIYMYMDETAKEGMKITYQPSQLHVQYTHSI